MQFLKKLAYKWKFSKDDFPGLDPINKKEKEIYGNQEPAHCATVVPYELGGPDPLWAIDCFKSDKQQSHFHFISLGFSNLFYDDEAFEDEYSGFGFELTFRHLPVDGDPEVPIWPANFFQNIARYVFKSKKGFDDYHFMSANSPIRNGTDTNITAFTFITDTEMGVIDTPHGKVKFLQLFGLTTTEYNDIKDKKITAKELIAKHQLSNPLLITDLTR